MSMERLLENQVAIVTGAGRGIGRAAAMALAEAGAAVVVAARSESEINGVAYQIREQGGKALAIPTDVSDANQVDHLLVLALRAFNRIDILVNNAALVQPMGNTWEVSPIAWQRLIMVNVIGPFLCARAVLPHMLDRGSGRIINVSSGVAVSNLKGTSAYNTSKAALERFSGTLAAELEGSGVVVTTFRPGIVDTPMQAEIRQTPARLFPRVHDWQSWYEDGQLRPAGEPAQALVWLASRFAGDANGQVFQMDDDPFRQQVAADLGTSLLPPRQR